MSNGKLIAIQTRLLPEENQALDKVVSQWSRRKGLIVANKSAYIRNLILLDLRKNGYNSPEAAALDEEKEGD